MSLHTLCVISALFSLTQPAFAATQQRVTPFEAIRTRLVLQPGQTYLSFMRREVKPGLDAYEHTIQADPAMRSHDFRQLQTNLIGEGAGVAIRIDGKNYIFNIGYLDGSDAQTDVKSGRSYGVGPRNTQSDPSDVAYLRELESYFRSEPDAVGDFIEALMKVLTNCDPSGWSKLSIAGQSVATDFLAIYTAESDRHLMVGLRPASHPWEIDLAAATLVSVFDVATGLIMQDGQLVRGSIQGWWAQGTQGSGIGETRRDRINLQRMIARFEAASDQAKKLSALLRTDANTDPIQGTFQYLNSPNGPLNLSGADAESLIEALKGYVQNVQQDARQIAGGRR